MSNVVLITGASSGIGKATAALLAKSGYTVYGAARRVEGMNDLLPLGVKPIAMDVSVDTSIVEGVNHILKEEGRIDLLVNNAGFGLYGAVEEVSMQDARYQLEVNVIGLARLIQLVLPGMRRQHAGKIVNITSVGGKIVSPFGAWYHVSKFGVEALSDALRLEVASLGIDVIVIEPGGVKTEWGDIAMQNLERTSSKGPYANKANKMVALAQKFANRNAEPSLIAQLILKAVTVAKPKTRYHAGFMAGTVLFAKKWLSDRQFDKMILSQLK
ncbi:oxidoreductase [Chitinophaga sp. 30R24]|uniref:oxidoreductase n=1 Tax=Chitinophaga sp. 30R24 TaxID=3248838 RepID=UPI003B9207C0